MLARYYVHMYMLFYYLDQVFIFTDQDLPQRFPAIPSNPITLTLEHLGKMFLDISILDISISGAFLYHGHNFRFVLAVY